MPILEVRRKFLKQSMKLSLAGILAYLRPSAFAIDNVRLPELGDSDRLYLTDRQAELLSKEILSGINDQGSLIEDFDVIEYLTKLGNALVSYSPMAGHHFSFFLINDKSINAFALPGGYICVNNGLIYYTLTED